MINSKVIYDSIELPFVSVIMPIRNEVAFIRKSLETVLSQDYPADRMEVIVADGISTDGTREIVESFQTQHVNLKVIDNPNQIVSSGLNKAILAAQGEIIIRMDGHSEFPKDYVTRLVNLLEATEAENVGGVLVASGTNNYVQRSIRIAYQSSLGIGQAQRSHANGVSVREVDAVHGGCWYKTTLMKVGLFDESMVRNQDDELSFRIRKQGGNIIQDTSIRIRYYVRDSYVKLFRQFLQYGFWKVRVIQKHPMQASLRHVMPSLFLMSLIGTGILSSFSSVFRVLFLVVTFFYLGIIAISALFRCFLSEKWILWPGIMVALLTMHLGYGLGFIFGILRWCLGFRIPVSIFKRITR